MAAEPELPGVRQAFEADEAARRAAIDTTGSFLLQAPAGSGKTTVLTCRLLALLATVEEPEEILAITFTRKAAAEMRERVLLALQRAEAGEASDKPEASFANAAAQANRARGWNLLATPARLRIMTIDAFCQTVCAQLPVTSRNGLRLEIATSPRPLYAAAARRALEFALSEAALIDGAQRLFARLDNDWERFEELMIAMLETRAHWLRHILAGDGEDPQLAERAAAGVGAVVSARLAVVIESLPEDLVRAGMRLAGHAARTLQRGGEELDDDARAWLECVGPLRAEPKDLARWRWLCALAVTGKGKWRKQWDRRQGLLPEHRAEKRELGEWVGSLAAIEGAEELFDEVLALPDVLISPEDAAALASLSKVLHIAAAELQLEFAAQGRVDFTAIASAARAGLTELGQPTDLALRFGGAIRHILIDEFQDTSLEQFELLGALTAGWETGDGRTLFAVGDPMQSIYQFREAEVGLFLRARDYGVGTVRLTALQLRRNFRSAPPLVEWFNRHCGAAFPERDDPRLAAIRYLPALAARTDLAGSVSVHAQPAGGEEAIEAEKIAALIAECRRATPDVSIAILVSARQHAASIIAVLQARGVAIRGVRLEALRERPVVRDLCSLARSLQHLGDRTAWLALLHAPACGLTLAQLQTLAEGQSATPWELLRRALSDARLDPGVRARLVRLSTALTPALEGAERALPLWQRVHRAWLRLGGPAAYAEERDLLDAQQFLQALASEPHAELLAGDAFDEFAADLYAAPASAADTAAIDVLTMHGAKGLEWDVVIVPGIGRMQRNDTDPLLHWLDLPAAEGRSDLLLAPIGAAGSKERRSLAHYIRRLRKHRARLEKARLLYVAATRARRQLHWFGGAVESKKGELAPRANTMLGLLWRTIAEEFRGNHAAAPQVTALPVALSSAEQWCLPADWSAHDLPPPATASRLAMSLREVAAQPEYLWVGMASRAVGTIVHAELQRLAQLPKLPLAPDSEAKAYQGWLAELGVLPEERAAAGERVYAALSRTLKDPRGRWLLGREHREAYSEWRLTGLHAGRIVNVIVDRLLIDAHGERWLVDYKTSSHEGSNLEEFLAREAERYGPQLQRYASLVAGVAPGPVRAALYFPLLGEFRELEPGAAIETAP